MIGSLNAHRKFIEIVFIKWLAMGACLFLLVGCFPGEDRQSVYYVPIPGPANNGEDGGGSSSNDNEDEDNPIGEAEGSTAPSLPIIEPGWEKTCISITEFKNTYRATLIFSLSLLKDASENSPERKFARQLKYLAKELKKSERDFSLALISPEGKEADATTGEKCGEPLLMSFSRE